MEYISIVSRIKIHRNEVGLARLNSCIDLEEVKMGKSHQIWSSIGFIKSQWRLFIVNSTEFRASLEHSVLVVLGCALQSTSMEINMISHEGRAKNGINVKSNSNDYQVKWNLHEVVRMVIQRPHVQGNGIVGLGSSRSKIFWQ